MYPLMINAFRRADHVAVALQARGYDPAVVRTNYSYRRMSFGEWASALMVIALVFLAPWL
jgi:energy-coupling factor transporter transmembrane protein EcfT